MRKVLPGHLVAIAALLTAFSALADTPSQSQTLPGSVMTQAIPGGSILADISGKTLYTSDADKDGVSACDAKCLQNWAPLAAAWLARPSGDWTLVKRNDGSRQWAYKNRPLYTFARDNKAGDVNGETNGWHSIVVARQFLPPDIAIWHSDFGPAFRTAAGKTLYVLGELRFNALGTKRHTGANLGLTECTGECLKDWPPLEAPADAKGVDDWTVIVRQDGIRQWAYKGWPVYRNVRDQKSGDTFGEGVTTVRNGLSGLSWQVATLL